MDIAGLNNFLLLIVAVGAGAPFAVWLLGAGVKRTLLRLSPPVESEAVLVCKRMEVKAKDSNKKAYTIYYMTFESAMERKEYETPSSAFALCAEGDMGVLSLHLGKFMGFKRHGRVI